MAHEHESGLSGAYDRTPSFPDWDSVLAREGHIGQAAELVEAQSIFHRKLQNVGDLVARDGDRIDGCDIIVDTEAGTVSLTEGRVYVKGRILSVDAATLETVPMAGSVHVGVRMTTTCLTEADEPALLGLHPGSLGEGEKGAARIIVSLAWGHSEDGGGVADLYSVYLLKDGVAIDQSPPPNLTGINAQIAAYDRDANGNYIVTGCRVTALGKTGADQIFSVSEGVANINGFKRTRQTALRHAEEDTSDLYRIPVELHTLGASPSTLTLRHGPIATIREVLIEKEVTQTISRGGVGGGTDVLPNTAVTEIIDVVQGATTFLVDTDYVQSGDSVSWAPGGGEPATGSSYDVTYRYLGVATPDEVTDTTITMSGGVDGGQAQVDYDFKLPRFDILGLDEDGQTVYLKGLSSRVNALPPQPPADVLPLALIENIGADKPIVTNIGVRAYTMARIDSMYHRLVDALDLIALERLQRDIDSREPISKNGVFVDPFTSDRYRDEGEAQTAAVFNGLLRLAIAPTFHPFTLAGVTLLDWSEVVIIEQALATSCSKINPYMNFDPLPASMIIDPPVDFWTVRDSAWASDSAAALSSPVVVSTRTSRTGRTTTTVTTRRSESVSTVDERTELLDFLREIDIDFVIEGFFPAENLASLTFDGVDVTPPGLSADGTGKIEGTFAIPAGITAGSKAVEATGAGGSEAAAIFVGQGTIEIEVLRRIITTTTSVRRTTTSRNADPLAQTFTLTEGRHIAGVNLKVCAIGDAGKPVIVEFVEVENGIPTQNVIAQAFYDMNDAVIGQWTEIRVAYPFWQPAGVEIAFVVKTNDPDHSISTARIGDFDAATQTPVSAQPYSVGTMLSSANASTWTPHQDEDICFQIIAARFNPTTRTVAIGSFDAEDMSDLLIRAEVELPTTAAVMYFEVELDDASLTLLRPGQAWELQEYYTGTVQIRAVLSGSATVSPVLFPVILAIEGELAASGTYVTRAFTMGTGVDLLAYLKTSMPTGSTITLDADAADDDWQSIPQNTQELLADPGWIERKYRREGHNASPVGRIRISLSGTPAARPMAYDFRAISAP